MGIRRQPQRDPHYRQPWDGSIDGVNVTQVGDGVAKCSARRGSKAAQTADATTPDRQDKGRVICWWFFPLAGILLAIAGAGLLALALRAIEGMA